MTRTHDILAAIEMTVTCDGCQTKEGEFGYDDYSFAEAMAKDGWRVTRAGNLLCPKCKRVKGNRNG